MVGDGPCGFQKMISVKIVWHAEASWIEAGEISRRKK